MSLVVSAPEIDTLAAALRTCLASLEHHTVDSWCAAVLGDLRRLLGADAASIMLPGSGGPPRVFSEAIAPAVVDAYASYHDRSDGPRPAARAGREGCVWSASEAWRGLGLHDREYWCDYRRPSQLYDTMGATIPLAGGGTATLCFYRDAQRSIFGERERALLTLLLPALQAGIARLAEQTALGVHLPMATLPSRDQVAAGARDGRSEGGVAPRRHAPAHMVDAQIALPLQTGADRGASAARDRPAPDDEARRARAAAAFGFTPREAAVAELLALGRSNAQIAGTLGISTHTARHHTENVLLKLGVRSRASVAAALYGMVSEGPRFDPVSRPR